MKNFFILLFSGILCLSNIAPTYGGVITKQAQEEAATLELELEAQGAILIDATTGDVLFDKNMNETFYPASITKLMTVLLALEYGKLDETITFSRDAVFSIPYNSSHIAIDAGEEITILQALYAIMLQSANEVSNGVGEHISGSMEDFALLMTQRAKELGCKNTNFINANGLHDENHYTTAYDMSLIAKELLKFDFFRELMACTYYEIPPTNKQSEIRYLHGQNQLLKSSSRFYYEDCIGGKTGFTDQAGNTLVSYAKRGDTELISVVLKSTGYGYYEDTAKIFDYGFNNFETCTLITQGDIGGVVSVTETGKKETLERGTINGMYSEGLVVTLPKDTPLSSITSTNDLQQTMEAPVKKGETLATTTFTLNNKTLGTISLVADKTIDIEPVIEDNNFFDSILSVRTMLLSLSIISLIIVVIRTLITANANKKRRKYRKLRQRKSSKYPH